MKNNSTSGRSGLRACVAASALVVLFVTVPDAAFAAAGRTGHAQPPAPPPGTGTITGVVTVGEDRRPVEHARVTLTPGGKVAFTESDGRFTFSNLGPGRFSLSAHIERVADRTVQVTLEDGATANVEIGLLIEAIDESVTVTASGQEEITSNSMQAVTVLGSDELAAKNPVSLGEALDHELGVSKRSFGPGNARPVVRGFDGDRVLVLQDGMKIGGLGFQSGDHAEPVDVLGLERIEVVRGPATLLYGSSAIGGVVNAIQGHETAQPGVRAWATGVVSSNNYQASGNGGAEVGGRQWLLFFSGGANRVNDYDTPAGRVTNSYVRGATTTVGGGWFGDRAWLSGNFVYDTREYGIPYDQTDPDAEAVFLDPRRRSVVVRGGFRDTLRFVESGQFSIQFNDYRHSEIDVATGSVGTIFNNDTVVYRGTADLARRGVASGSLGFEGMHRDYDPIGDEAIAPPTIQNQFAVFGLETLNFERVVVQFGGRIEHNGYDSLTLPDRGYTGFSGAVGVRVPLPHDFSVVANVSSSYRAPALEELYNNGPHPGNLAFEIGDVNLGRERSTGFDAGLRHTSSRVQLDVNVFWYGISNFIYLAPTGEFREGLVVSNVTGADSRFTGFEARSEIALTDFVRLTLGFDATNAKITESDTPLPRIPPLRGRAGLDFRAKGFRVTPEVVFSDRQDRVFPYETETAGFATFQVGGGYTWVGSHVAHVVSIEAFNLTDRLYRNHLSFIKDVAPEIGRGVRLAYTIKYF